MEGRTIMKCMKFAATIILSTALGMISLQAEVVNGGFEETDVRDANSPEIQALVKLGWKFQSPLLWPTGWNGSASVSNITFAVTQANPHSGKNGIELWGQNGSSGYLAEQVKGLKKGIYKLTYWGRGAGTATLMFAGVHIVLNAKMTDTWAEYAGVYWNTTEPALAEAALTLQAQNGQVFFDDVNVALCSVLDAALVVESTAMRKEGKWLAPDAKIDVEACRKDLDAVTQAIPNLKKCLAADPIPDNVELIRLMEEKVAQYLAAKTGAPSVQQANEAAACVRITGRLATEWQFEDVKE